MAESNFVDYVKIYCRSGKGGRGSTHMRREKYIPNGGPDGGDGGRGGHIILRGNRNYWTLLHLRYDRHALAGHGESGSKTRSFGKDGEDKIIEVHFLGHHRVGRFKRTHDNVGVGAHRIDERTRENAHQK